MTATGHVLILASTSRFRRAMLEAAGIACETAAPGVDESALKRERAGQGADAVAMALAEAKARAVSARRPAAVVIGADQVLDLDGRPFDKPADRAGAETQLRALRGRAHTLSTAVCVARGGVPAWRHLDRARLTMREFGDAFLADYLDAIGDAATWSAGAYQVEGRGIQLFTAIEGDHFAILGLPLLPLIAYLRGLGLLET